MRVVGPVVLSIVSACSSPNPVFGLMTEPIATDSGAATTSEATADPTTAATATTHDLPTGDASAESTVDPSTTRTVDPDTGETTDPTTTTTGDVVTTTGSSTGESLTTTTAPDTGESWVCEPDVNDSPTRTVFDLAMNKDWSGCNKQTPLQTILGTGAMKDGHMLFNPGGADCIYKNVFALDLGHGYPAPDRIFCGKFIIDWVDNVDTCEIAAFTFIETTQDGPEYLYGRYHSPATDPGNTPFMPQILKPGSCGCPPIEPFCCELEPGQHTVVVGGVQVEPGGDITMIEDGLQFANFNTIVSPECLDDPAIPPQLDWFAVVL